MFQFELRFIFQLLNHFWAEDILLNLNIKEWLEGFFGGLFRTNLQELNFLRTKNFQELILELVLDF